MLCCTSQPSSAATQVGASLDAGMACVRAGPQLLQGQGIAERSTQTAKPNLYVLPDCLYTIPASKPCAGPASAACSIPGQCTANQVPGGCCQVGFKCMCAFAVPSLIDVMPLVKPAGALLLLQADEQRVPMAKQARNLHMGLLSSITSRSLQRSGCAQHRRSFNGGYYCQAPAMPTYNFSDPNSGGTPPAAGGPSASVTNNNSGRRRLQQAGCRRIAYYATCGAPLLPCCAGLTDEHSGCIVIRVWTLETVRALPFDTWFLLTCCCAAGDVLQASPTTAARTAGRARRARTGAAPRRACRRPAASSRPPSTPSSWTTRAPTRRPAIT